MLCCLYREPFAMIRWRQWRAGRGGGATGYRCAEPAGAGAAHTTSAQSWDHEQSCIGTPFGLTRVGLHHQLSTFFRAFFFSLSFSLCLFTCLNSPPPTPLYSPSPCRYHCVIHRNLVGFELRKKSRGGESHFVCAFICLCWRGPSPPPQQLLRQQQKIGPNFLCFAGLTLFYLVCSLFNCWLLALGELIHSLFIMYCIGIVSVLVIHYSIVLRSIEFPPYRFPLFFVPCWSMGLSSQVHSRINKKNRFIMISAWMTFSKYHIRILTIEFTECNYNQYCPMDLLESERIQ